jgi:DNA-directed RNA polymerase I subunit RPA49
MYLALARTEFANSSRNNDMPRWNIDNLMTHVAAAALVVDDFEVDVNDLREDLKIENKEYVICHRGKNHSS